MILVRNTDKGGGNRITLSLSKPMDDSGWSWLTGYTHTQAKEVSSGTSSQNTSNWNYTPTADANAEIAYDSRYAFKHRFTGQVTKQWKFLATTRPNCRWSMKGAVAVLTTWCSTMPMATATVQTTFSTCRRAG